ncbi:MFS transporter [Streptosporangium sp. NPDC049078]|uniref:MFS transporter n=1 Tax=Streptosporangium sp. NPDC049078 TaxID=3155767 RepID=UPI0034388B78
MTATAHVRLIRDRATWLIYLQFGVFATYLYGLSSALPLLRLDQGVSQAVAGLHGTAMAAGGIVTGLVLPWVVGRIGRRAAIWTGMAGISVGTLMVAAAPTLLPVTLLGYGVAGALSALVLFPGMAALDDRHGPAGPAAISEANAVCVIVGIGVPFVVSAAAQSALGWRAALLVTSVLAALLALAMGRVRIPEPEKTVGGAATDGEVRFGWRFYLAAAVLFCCVAMEFCFNLWAAKLFSDQTGLPAAVAATAVAAFTAGMAAGRLAGAWLALRIPPTALFLGALLVSAVGWAIFWLSTDPVFSYVGLAVSGLGVALHFPMALSRLLAASGGRRDRASAMAAIFSGLAVGSGPFLLGALADGFGTQRAFLMVPALIGLAVAGLLVVAGERSLRSVGEPA